MADMSKAERLAAARKKLQDYQRKKEGVPIPDVASLDSTPELNVGLHSFTPEQPQQVAYSEVSDQNAQIFNPPPADQLYNTNTIPTSNEEVIVGVNQSTPVNGTQPGTTGEVSSQANRHDSATAPDVGWTEIPTVFSASSYFSNVGTEPFSSGVNGHEIEVAPAFFTPPQESAFGTAAHLFAASDDKTERWEPTPFSTPATLEQANIFGVHQISHLNASEQTSETQLPLPLKEENSQRSPPLLENVPHELVEDQLENNSIKSFEINTTGKKELELPLSERSSAESIRQLTDQITHLFDPPIVEEEKQGSSFVSSLETRNQELAAQLETERRMNQQLQFALKESQSQVSHLELKVQDVQSQQEVVLLRHLGPLQEQLRAHAQTVGILVGEKTELEAAIAHHTATAKQHAGEVEELQNRLKASRHRVSEVEKELTSVTSAANAADKVKNNHAHEVDQLRLQNGMLSKQLEDAEEEASELRQKLSARISEVNALTSQLQEKQSQLSLSQLRVTQLSASDNPEASAEIESLHQLKISLERRCTELTEAVRQLSADRDQADQQYRQYVAQLNGQLHSANIRLDSLSMDNERLKTREEDLVQNMSELERQLQQQMQLQQQQQLQHNQLQQTQQHVELKSDGQSNLLEKISLLEEEKQQLQSLLDLEAQKFASLETDVVERDMRIADLETLCNERPDQSRLLAAMESDKVAAAQATSQNTILKQQLQELQDGFIKMSNDKLNLTESLEHEKHVNKEMGEKISQLAEELHELRVLVTEKERRLQEYRELEHDHNHEHNHERNHHEQNHDLNHVDEHHNCNGNHANEHAHSDNATENSNHIHEKQYTPSTTTLQEQLNQAHEHIHNLNSQNNSLRRLIAQKSTESHESGSSSSATEGATTDDAAADAETNCEDTSDSQANYGCMQYAMEKLQERFTRTMAEVAELTDEKQRLEHLVLQLQGETETIGEYVALYQMQRAALQQRAREKDHQLSSLSAEREDLRRKLQELNQLVQRLLDDRGTEMAKEALPSLEMSNENTTNINESDVIEIPPETIGQEMNANKDVAKRLTKQILSIIEDIGVPNDAEASFHPCPWCSGRLKNV